MVCGFSDALVEIGSIRSRTDTSIFINYASYGLTVLLLYVDDIIITGASSTFIYFIISRLHYRFEVKDLGPLHYFLGIEVHGDASRIHLSQTKYALELLKRANFLLAKPCSSLVTTSTKLTKDDNTPLVDATSYRSIVGALQHLTMIRPDITYAMNQACQLIHRPRQTYLIAVKRILRYLKDTPHFGMHIIKSQNEHLLWLL